MVHQNQAGLVCNSSDECFRNKHIDFKQCYQWFYESKPMKLEWPSEKLLIFNIYVVPFQYTECFWSWWLQIRMFSLMPASTSYKMEPGRDPIFRFTHLGGCRSIPDGGRAWHNILQCTLPYLAVKNPPLPHHQGHHLLFASAAQNGYDSEGETWFTWQVRRLAKYCSYPL